MPHATSDMDTQYALTQEQKDHFLEHGWIKLSNCFSREKAEQWCDDMWVRLGYKKDDPSTWKVERVNMPWHKTEPVQTFAPKAWAAMCELVGGAERLHPNSDSWAVSNPFPVALRGKHVLNSSRTTSS